MFPAMIERAQLRLSEQRQLAEDLAALLRRTHSLRLEDEKGPMAFMGVLSSPVPHIPQLRNDPALGCWAYALLVMDLLRELEAERGGDG